MRRTLPDIAVCNQGATPTRELSAVEEAAAEDQHSGLWAEDERGDMGPEPIHPDSEVY